MTVRGRHFYLIVLGQAVCVAVGLWLHYRLLETTAHYQIEAALWSDIEVASEHALDEIDAEAAVARNPAADTSASTPTAGADRRLRPCHFTIVDREWKVVRQYRTSGAPAPAEVLTAGAAVAWVPQAQQTAERDAPLRGRLDTPGGQHLAVARPLPDGGGYLLTHRPASDIDAALAPLSQGLLPVGGVTLLWTVALLSITVHLILMRQREMLDRVRTRSSTDTLRQTQLLIRTRDALIFALAKLAGFRDDETGNHLERISAYCVQLASALQRHPKFSSQITPAFARLIGLSSILHDIGKVGVEDSVLRKPGKLTPEERRQMQRHTSIAGRCLQEIAQSLGSSNFLEMARDVAVAHHEWWDGSGYPNGLRGEAIPLSARIVAIADVYDALATRRVYKDILPHERCVTIIREGRGTQFDPDLVDVWLTIEEQFRSIASRYASAPIQVTTGGTEAPAWNADEPAPGPALPSPATADEARDELRAESSALL
jgi:HD-GYP domain-containing protein (c-di-GMP phosphodiesterase class II)